MVKENWLVATMTLEKQKSIVTNFRRDTVGFLTNGEMQDSEWNVK